MARDDTRIEERPDVEIIRTLLDSDAFESLITNYNAAITLLLAMVTLAIIAAFFINVARLSASGDNEYKRTEAIHAILICLVCMALVGGIDVVYAVIASIVFSM